MLRYVLIESMISKLKCLRNREKLLVSIKSLNVIEETEAEQPRLLPSTLMFGNQKCVAVRMDLFQMFERIKESRGNVHRGRTENGDFRL